MKTMMTAFAGVAVLFSMAAFGQSTGDKPAAATMTIEQGAAAQDSARPAAGRRTHVDADARHCLDLSTNVQIIRCAEKYLRR